MIELYINQFPNNINGLIEMNVIKSNDSISIQYRVSYSYQKDKEGFNYNKTIKYNNKLYNVISETILRILIRYKKFSKLERRILGENTLLPNNAKFILKGNILKDLRCIRIIYQKMIKNGISTNISRIDDGIINYWMEI